ncbi:excisionase [Bacteroides sp. CAG:530]|nr:excisionase [Bacteroides sp. CAG:530]
MSQKNITFEEMPRAMVQIMEKLDELKSMLGGISQPQQQPVEEQWMNLKELQDYLPSHPADQTIYGWTSTNQIPFHKRGKRIMFLKSEIDGWLHDGKIKSQGEIEKEALQYIMSKKKRTF